MLRAPALTSRVMRLRHLVAEIGLDHRGSRATVGGRAVGDLPALVQHEHALDGAQQRRTACSIQITARPSSSRRRRISRAIASTSLSVSPAATSSSSSTRGRVASAMPISSRRCRAGVIARRPAASATRAETEAARGCAPRPSAAPAPARASAGELQAEATLPATVMPAKTRGVWKVRAMPRARTGAAGAGQAPPTEQLARRRRHHAGQRVEEGGLAGAVRADDADQLARRERGLTASTAVSPPKRTRDAARLEQRVSDVRASAPAARRGQRQRQRRQAARQVQHRRRSAAAPSAIMYSYGNCRRRISASRLNTSAATSGPHSVAAPPIRAISTVWKPMKGLNTAVGSM